MKLNYKLYCKDSRDMSEVKDKSVHLIITSPPYNVNKEYEKELGLEEYLLLLKDVFKECNRVLIDGGRICVNICNVKRKPYTPYTMYITQMLLNDLNLIMRGEIIWYKESGCNLPTTWGSWMSVNNPFLRDQHEYILVFSKTQYERYEAVRGKLPKLPKQTISREEFLENTKSVWRIPGVCNPDHPAVFPLELPWRLIQLYSFEADIILDPFCGSGTTLEAALKLNRNAIGYDIKTEYIDLTRNRISQIGAIDKWLNSEE